MAALDFLTPEVQEWIALGIVALVAAWTLYRGLRGLVAPRIARALLKRGYVRWAMRVHHSIR